MGAIGGIYLMNGENPDPRALEALSLHQSQIGPDGKYTSSDGPVALLYRPFRTQPSCAGEDQVYRSIEGDVLIWNGRLDNRDEIVRLLEISTEKGPPPAELIYLAIRRWGFWALAKVLGDFSLVLWQPAQRRLILGTDIWALKPVFYYLDSTRLVWASRCRAIAEAQGIPLEVEDEFVANFLIRPRPVSRSPLKRIHKLPPASCLVVEGSRSRIERYWSPDPHRQLVYAREEDYEQHYRELLGQAIACRLEAAGPVFAELSGGYDSSSIVCIGDSLVRARKVSTPEIRTVSYIYTDSPSSDEREYITPVERAVGKQGLHIDNKEAPLLTVPPGTLRPDLPVGQLVYFARNQHLADRMAEHRSRVLLRGFGGDQITWGDIGFMPFEIGDHLVTGRWGRAVRASREWALAQKSPVHQVLWRGGIWPLLPRSIRKYTSSFALPLGKWLHPDFVRRLDLRDATLGPALDIPFRLPSQANLYGTISEMAQLVGWEFILDRGCVECRFPFFDRRLVEFALATPMEKMVTPSQPRRMARKALEGVLPPEVQARRSKAGPDEAVYRTFSRNAAHLAPLVEDPLVGHYGFIDPKTFKATFDLVRFGTRVATPQLLRTFALEFWLRSLRDRHEDERYNPLPSNLEMERTTKEVAP